MIGSQIQEDFINTKKYRWIMEGCKHLNDIVNAEMPIIKEHLQSHKWYQHIETDTKAQIDFIEKYGFIMREMYCRYVCVDRKTCELNDKYR